MQLTDHEMLRYNRQIMLKSVDFDGQEKLKDSRALIVGLGGLGCAAGQYLAAGGVGQLMLVDFDRVSLSNLQRQILHRDQDIEQFKVLSARQRLTEINPHIQIDTLNHQLSAEEWAALIPHYDVVLDCTDNVAIRKTLNQSCFQAKVPLVSGSAIRFEGQISVFDYRPHSPCYHCLSQLFGENHLTCVEAGVISPIVGIVGSLQALEAMKLLLGIGQSLSGKLLMIDGLNFAVRTLNLQKQPDCMVCHQKSE